MRNFVKTTLFVILLTSPSTLLATKHAKKEEIKITSKNSPNLDIAMIDGTNFNLQQSNNSFTIINFWAHWCGICRSELKTLEKIYQKHKNNNIEIIGISIDDKNKIEAVQKITQKLSFRNGFFDDARIIDFKMPKSIPETYIINKKGEIIRIYKGELERDEIERIISDKR